MNRPPTRTMVMGHPVVAMVLLAAAGITGLAAWQAGSDGLFAGAVAIAAFFVIGNAHQQASAYKRWKRDWNAMAGPASQGAKHPNQTLLKILLVPMMATLVIAVQHYGAAAALAGWFGLIVLAMLIALSSRLLGRFRGRAVKAPPAVPVAVVAKPLLRAPTLRHAYAALPDYCQRILSPQAR